MTTVTSGQHDTIIVLKYSGEEVYRFPGRRTLSSALVAFATEKFGNEDIKITAGRFGTTFTSDDGTVYRATYARKPKK